MTCTKAVLIFTTLTIASLSILIAQTHGSVYYDEYDTEVFVKLDNDIQRKLHRVRRHNDAANLNSQRTPSHHKEPDTSTHLKHEKRRVEIDEDNMPYKVIDRHDSEESFDLHNVVQSVYEESKKRKRNIKRRKN